MSTTRSTINTLIAGAFALSLASGGNAAVAAGSAGKEKCYGVAKAGKNDCAAADKSHSCAAHATMNGSGGDFLVLPKGICAKLVGGSMAPIQASGPMPADPDTAR